MEFKSKNGDQTAKRIWTSSGRIVAGVEVFSTLGQGRWTIPGGAEAISAPGYDYGPRVLHEAQSRQKTNDDGRLRRRVQEKDQVRHPQGFIDNTDLVKLRADSVWQAKPRG